MFWAITIIGIVAFIFFVVPYLLWFRNNMAKVRGTFEFKHKEQMWWWFRWGTLISLSLFAIIGIMFLIVKFA